MALDAEVWLGPDHQLANRIAHAVWLRRMGIEAWLALDGSEIPFVGTPILPAADTTELGR